jgi:regulator of replication initiation timing
MPSSIVHQQQQQKQQDDLIPSFHELTSTTSSNYSLNEQSRTIAVGDQETRLKQLYNQVEQLSLSNARLVRANRILKLDCDRIVDEKTTELKQALKLSIEQNIRLQRSNRLLQDDYELKKVDNLIERI